ncbi:helix-turn-helix transcriptional regulator [Lysobacter capsici]|nr:helix-turn-helix transcriptional regulator [Lysobacter capsici]
MDPGQYRAGDDHRFAGRSLRHRRVELSQAGLMQGSISNNIRVLRFHHGEMSQAQLGQRIGLTRQTVAAIEAGKYSPSLEAAFRIAQVFGVPLTEVFQWQAAASD